MGWRGVIAGWWGSLVAMFYPNVCEVCGVTLVRGERVMCLSCRMKMPRTMTHRAPEPDSIRCRLASTAVVIERVAAYFHYYRGDTYARLIHFAKYNHRPEVARWLAEDFAGELLPDNFFDGIDMIVPVPLHRSKLRRRGYNQAMEIARGISEVTGIEVAEVITAARAHGSQTRLGSFGRWLNARDAYDAPGASSHPGSHFLIVDDVLTTGATLLACAEAIHRHNPGSRVSALTLAATHLR